VTPGLEPFQIAVPQPALDDLAECLRRARLPGAAAAFFREFRGGVRRGRSR